MEWLDYADCAGDDPLKWDLDHVEADDVQAYARNVCGDCPVRRECAAHAIEDRLQVGRIFNELVADNNPHLAIGDRVEAEGAATVRQSGVIRGGVALVGDYEEALYLAAGREWHGFKECTGCGRTLYSDWRIPESERPEGAVRQARAGICRSCARGGTGTGASRDTISPQKAARVRECEALYRSGLKLGEVADRMGVHKSTVQKYLELSRDGA